MDFEWLK